MVLALSMYSACDLADLQGSAIDAEDTEHDATPGSGSDGAAHYLEDVSIVVDGERNAQVVEGRSTHAFNVRLSSPISSDIEVMLVPSEGSRLEVLAQPHTFTPETFNDAVPFLISLPDNEEAEGTVVEQVTFVAKSHNGGAIPMPVAKEVVLVDDDAPGLIVEISNDRQHRHGSRVSIRLSLSAPPVDDVVVSISNRDGLAFTYGNSQQSNSEDPGNIVVFTSSNYWSPVTFVIDYAGDAIPSRLTEIVHSFAVLAQSDVGYQNVQDRNVVFGVVEDSVPRFAFRYLTPPNRTPLNTHRIDFEYSADVDLYRLPPDERRVCVSLSTIPSGIVRARIEAHPWIELARYDFDLDFENGIRHCIDVVPLHKPLPGVSQALSLVARVVESEDPDYEDEQSTMDIRFRGLSLEEWLFE